MIFRGVCTREDIKALTSNLPEDEVEDLINMLYSRPFGEISLFGWRKTAFMNEPYLKLLKHKMVTGKLFLHIGMHKTGSSSIQFSLNGFENESIRYAKLGFENHSVPIYTAFSEDYLNYHIWKRQGLSDENIIRKKEELLQIIRKELRHLKDIIISGEDISALAERINVPKKEIVDAGKDVSVIAYVRDPASYLKSEFSERVKMGMNDLFILNYKDRFKKFLMSLEKTR